MSRNNRPWKSRSPEYRARHTCRRKKAYKDQFIAEFYAALYWCSGFALGTAYQCEVCSEWHLSTRGKQ